MVSMQDVFDNGYETEDEFNESMNDCDHGRFYEDYAQCRCKGCPMSDDMKSRVEQCRAQCIRQLDKLGYPYEIKMPDRMYALRAENCVCGMGRRGYRDTSETICTCPRPDSIVRDDKVIKNNPFTAIEIMIDCENYTGIQEVYKALGVEENKDNKSPSDDRIALFCLRKAYYDSF